jgi:hypothetical protein
MAARTLALAATLAAVVALTAGCGSGAPEATRSAPSSPAATVAPLATPSPGASEVTRSTFGGGALKDPTGSTPGSGALAVDVACAGVDGSVMRWSLVAGDGTSLGLSGEADCSGPPTTSWLGITAQQRPATVRVRLLPASGVVSGYAIVRRGAF